MNKRNRVSLIASLVNASLILVGSGCEFTRSVTISGASLSTIDSGPGPTPSSTPSTTPSTGPSTTPNTAPTANAGTDKTITLPTSTVSITGSGTDGDGTISSYSWIKVSGGTATLTNATTATLSLSALVAGSYVFRLTVTDNQGATATDDVAVTVNAAAANVAPTANAGVDKTMTLPTNSVSITGTGSDSDGWISSYAWTKVSGGTATLTGTATATLSLSALVAGSYVFRLTVTDNSGSTATDDVMVSVTAAGNTAPTANAGADKTITLPTTTLSITGSAADTDGTIASYSWAKISGANATLGTATTSTLSLSNLTSGSYVFRLTVTDNGGATATDDVRVIVYAKAGNFDYTRNNYVAKATGVPGHVIHFPKNYQQTGGTGYPLLIFMHGLGQVGNGTTDLYLQDDNPQGGYGLPTGTALPYVMNKATQTWNDDHIPMIVMSPQIPSGFDWDWCTSCVEDAYTYATTHYNVDLNRVYFTGLSLGGRGVYTVMKDANLNKKVAALVGISAYANVSSIVCDDMKHMGLWHFNGANDGTFSLYGAQTMIGAINMCKIPGYQAGDATFGASDSRAHTFPSSSTSASAGWDIYYGYPSAVNKTAATLTAWTGVGHSGWDNVYSGKHGGTSYGYDGQAYTDIYQWLLTFSLDGSPYSP